MVPAPAQYARIAIPILTITGQYDADQPGALAYYQRHMQHGSAPGTARHFLVMGPWDHDGTRTPAEEVGGLKFGKASLLDLNQLHKEWYDWTMKGGKQPAFLEKRVAYYVAGTEAWKYSDSLASIAAKPMTLYLSTPAGNATDVFHSGKLSPEMPGDQPAARYVYDPLDTRPAELEKEEVSNSLTNQRDAINLLRSALIYHSEPLPQETEITGIPKVAAWITFDVPDTDFGVALFEINPDGSSVLLSSGLMRARYRASLQQEQLIKSGEAVRYEFSTFRFFSRRIAKGSRLRLLFGALNSSQFEKNYNGGGDVAAESRADAKVAHVTLHQDGDHPSWLQIPVVEPSPK